MLDPLREGIVAEKDMFTMSGKEAKRLHSIRQALAKKITEGEAASLIGLSDRQIRRLIKRIGMQNMLLTAVLRGGNMRLYLSCCESSRSRPFVDKDCRPNAPEAPSPPALMALPTCRGSRSPASACGEVRLFAPLLDSRGERAQ